MNAIFYIQGTTLKCFGDEEVAAEINPAALKQAIETKALYLEDGDGWLLDVVRNPGQVTLALIWRGKLYEQKMTADAINKLFA